MADNYKNVYNAVYAMLTEVSNTYGFDCDAAMNAVEESGHIQTIVNLMKHTDSMSDDTKSVDSKTKRSPLEQARHNVQLWTKKLEANKFPDDDKKKKHIEKLDKERKKLEKLEGTPAPAPAPAEKPAPAPAEKPAPAPAPAPAEKPAPAPAPAPAEKKTKNIPRWGKDKHGAEFKKVIQEAGVEFTDDIEKEFRKLADTMPNDEWTKDGKTYLDHMRVFAKSKTADADTVPEEEAAPDVHVLTLDKLKSIKMITPLAQVGSFWDADNGRFVTGPAEEGDEDFTETKFKNTKYVVGDNTGRVYLQTDNGDKFAGFIGIGEFKMMTV